MNKIKSNIDFKSTKYRVDSANNNSNYQNYSVNLTSVNQTNIKPSKELMEALDEGEDILKGKVKVKGYHNVREMFEDILNEGEN